MTSFDFGCEFTNRVGEGVIVPTDLQLLPVRWNGASLGGPKEAEIAVTGSRASIKALRNWLRFGVRIVNRRGANCWHGYVQEVEIQLSGISIVSSLDNLRNRIAVTYSSTVGAIEAAATTAWASDAGSVAEYGTKEHVESLGSATATMGTALQSRMLAAMAWPKLKRGQDGGGDFPTAVLRCRGWYAATAWKYYQRTDGKLEHMPSGSEEWPIGWGIAGAVNQIAFGGYGIHDSGGRLEYLPAGATVNITGSVSNNKAFTLADGTSEEVEVYGPTTAIYFQSSDDIFDSGDGMGFSKSDHWLYVAGSAANSRYHFIGSAGSDHIRTSAGISGAIVNEAVGQSITLTQLQKIPTMEVATAEAPSAAAVTATLYGHQIAQKVTLGYAMTLDRVQIEAAKIGAPSDSIAVEIRADSAGTIGSVLSSGTLAAANLTDSVTAVWIPITAVTLAAGNYWILVKRSGATNGLNHYKLGMTKEAYSTCLQWTGSTWNTFAIGWYLRFRLWAVEDTGTMIEKILQASAQFVTVNTGFLAGINGHTTMDQIAVARDEIERLAAIGTSSGNRVLIDVTSDRVMRLAAREAALAEQVLLYFTANGQRRLTNSAGSAWEAGVLPLGRWVEFADLDSDLATLTGLSPAFIEEAEYNAESGQWSLTFEGERSLADLIKVQQG
jgi:hypothetical protein